jgi:hypothetical protein
LGAVSIAAFFGLRAQFFGGFMKHGYFKGNKVAECQDSQTSLMEKFKKQGIVDEWREADPNPSGIDVLDREALDIKSEADLLEAERVATEKAEAERVAAEKEAAAKAESERLEAEKAKGGGTSNDYGGRTGNGGRHNKKDN